MAPRAGVQPWQDPGGALRMNGVGKREKTRETSLDRAKSSRERESDQTGCAAKSGRVWQCFFLTVAFIP